MSDKELKELIKEFSDPICEQRNKIKYALDITYELAIDDEMRFNEYLLLLNYLLKKFDCFIDELNNIE